jgi:glycosyltransferase involved in cell wall biosynthesis
MDRVAAVITTRDRTALFEKAFRSVIAQTRKPDLFIVTSDSTEENFEIEKGIVGDKAILIRNRYARNYAGNLNTALDWTSPTSSSPFSMTMTHGIQTIFPVAFP